MVSILGLITFSLFFNDAHILTILAATVSDDDVIDVTALVAGPITPGGGSGGGSSGSIPTGAVVISGIAFPNAKLTLVKDGQITSTLNADSNGSFYVTIHGLNNGTYQLAIYAEDRNGVVSASHVMNVIITGGNPPTFANILIPPTIAAAPTSVVAGSELVVSGYAQAGSNVVIGVPSSYNLGNALADSNGYYRLASNPSLNSGTYQLRAKADLNGFSSMYSKPVAVQIYRPGQVPGTPGQPTPPSQYGLCVDYNRDGRVNLIDFSILIFWFKKENPPAHIDCNADHLVDMKDFSILMYFWTG